MSGFKVYEKQCKNCLLTKDRIVPGSRAKEIIQRSLESGTYFVCHKASMNEEEICCRGFYDAFKQDVKIIRMAEYFDIIEEVPQTDDKKLTPYK